MNTSSSIKEAPYLEDIAASVEYIFATANKHHVMSSDRITYFDAFNKVGKKIYKTDWSGREFFASRGYTDVDEYKMNKKISYSLFETAESESQCFSRVGYAEYPIIMALRAGELQAFCTNHYTGEETVLEPSFWRSHKCSFTRITGYFKAPDRMKRPAVPGVDFIVVLDLKGFEKVLRAMPRPRNKDACIPSDKDHNKARQLIVELCKNKKFFLSRDIYYDALNQILGTDYYQDSNSRSDWNGSVPASIKNSRGYKNPNPLPLDQLPKSL